MFLLLQLDEGNLVVEERRYRDQREANVNIDEDMISGTTRRCKACTGSGILGIGSGNAKQCPFCDGTGEISSNENYRGVGSFRGVDRINSDKQLPSPSSSDSDEF